MRLVNANFDSGDKFYTLTYRENQTDVGVANRDWDRFMKRMRRRYGNFVWAMVTEFQERGAVHFHWLGKLPYIPVSEIEKLWGHGFVKVNRVEHVDNLGAYLSKYMTADLADVRLAGHRAWRVSRNAERPVEYRGDDARAFLGRLGVLGRSVALTRAYESEYHGLITYEQYNLKR